MVAKSHTLCPKIIQHMLCVKLLLHPENILVAFTLIVGVISDSVSDDWLVNDGNDAFALIASGSLIGTTVLLFASSNIASTKSTIDIIINFYRRQNNVHFLSGKILCSDNKGTFSQLFNNICHI